MVQKKKSAPNIRNANLKIQGGQSHLDYDIDLLKKIEKDLESFDLRNNRELNEMLIKDHNNDSATASQSNPISRL